METTTKRLTQIRCIPMIKSVTVEQASALGEALLAGGLPAANVSQQESDGLELLRALAARFPDLLVGGGNVQTMGEARNAIEAGARFIFSPIFDPQMVELCQQQSVAVYPVTKEGLLAVTYNVKVLGFYPIEKLGGLRAIDKLGNQFGLQCIVAGSITEQTVKSYLANQYVLAVTGSWMIDPILVANHQWSLITQAFRKAALN